MMHVYGAKRSDPLDIQVLVGQDVVVVFLVLEPGDDRRSAGNCQVISMLEIRYFGRMFMTGRR